MSQQQRNHQNKKNRNNQNRKNDQRNRSNNTEQKTDKKVPMHYQVSNSKDSNTVELKYTDRDGAVDKTKLNIFKDGSDEEFLKLVKELINMILSLAVISSKLLALTSITALPTSHGTVFQSLWFLVGIGQKRKSKVLPKLSTKCI